MFAPTTELLALSSNTKKCALNLNIMITIRLSDSKVDPDLVYQSAPRCFALRRADKTFRFHRRGFCLKAEAHCLSASCVCAQCPEALHVSSVRRNKATDLLRLCAICTLLVRACARCTFQLTNVQYGHLNHCMSKPLGCADTVHTVQYFIKIRRCLFFFKKKRKIPGVNALFRKTLPVY